MDQEHKEPASVCGHWALCLDKPKMENGKKKTLGSLLYDPFNSKSVKR